MTHRKILYINDSEKHIEHLLNGFKTPAQAANAIPIIFGITAGIGAATGLSSLGLQVAQHIQAQEQVKDQQELILLQKELSKRQLAQYRKADEEEAASKMFRSPVSTPMVTRSMARQTQVLPNQVGGSGVVNMGYVNRGASLESINLVSSRNSRSLGGSYESLTGQQMEMMNRNRMTITPSSSGSSISLFNSANRSGRGQLNPMQLTNRLSRVQTQRALNNFADDERAPLQPLNRQLRANLMRMENLRAAPRPRGSMPRAEFLRYANRGRMDYPNVMRTFGRAIRRHKRKLLIGGAVIGAAAGIIAGGIYGARASTGYKQGDFAAKEKKDAKTEKDMQYDKPMGVFEKISNTAVSDGSYGDGGGGGGGSGGFGANQKALHAAAGGFAKAPRKRRRSKKSSTHKSRKPKGGKVTKRRRRKAPKHINKRAKKTRRHRRRKAF